MKLLRCIIDDCGVWVVDTCISWHAWTAHRKAIQPGERRRYFASGDEGPPRRFEVPGTAPIPQPRHEVLARWRDGQRRKLARRRKRMRALTRHPRRFTSPPPGSSTRKAAQGNV